MQLAQTRLQGRITLAGGLDQQRDLGSFLDDGLPAVGRKDRAELTDTGGQSELDEVAPDARRCRLVRTIGQDQKNVVRLTARVSPRRPAIAKRV